MKLPARIVGTPGSYQELAEVAVRHAAEISAGRNLDEPVFSLIPDAWTLRPFPSEYSFAMHILNSGLIFRDFYEDCPALDPRRKIANYTDVARLLAQGQIKAAFAAVFANPDLKPLDGGRYIAEEALKIAETDRALALDILQAGLQRTGRKNLFERAMVAVHRMPPVT